MDKAMGDLELSPELNQNGVDQDLVVTSTFTVSQETSVTVQGDSTEPEGAEPPVKLPRYIEIGDGEGKHMVYVEEYSFEEDDTIEEEEEEESNFQTTDDSEPEDHLRGVMETLCVRVQDITLDDGTSTQIYHAGNTLQNSVDVIEYILSDECATRSLSLLNGFWSSFLEEYVDPSGWSAVYSSPEDVLSFGPSKNNNFIVTVSSIDFDDQIVLGKVAKICNETGEVVEVGEELKEFQLKNLYPLEKQKYEFNMDNICRGLHLHRVFSHIHMPSDPITVEEFVEKNLQRRKEFLFEDLPTLPCSVRKQITDLIQKSRALHPIVESNLRKLKYCDDDLLGTVEMQKLQMSSVEEQFELRDMEYEYKKYENPLYRPALMSSTGSGKKFRKDELYDENVIVVIRDLVCNSNLLATVQSFVQTKFGESEKFRLDGDLQNALSQSKSGSTIVVGPGIYRIYEMGNLETGGTVIGLMENNRPVIECKDSHDTWLVLSPDADKWITLENLDLRTSPRGQTGMIILLKSGCLSLNNVHITGLVDKTAEFVQTTYAVKALANTTLKGNGVRIDGFSVGLSLSQGVKAELVSSQVTRSGIGIQMDNEGLVLDSIDITDCDVNTVVGLVPFPCPSPNSEVDHDESPGSAEGSDCDTVKDVDDSEGGLIDVGGPGSSISGYSDSEGIVDVEGPGSGISDSEAPIDVEDLGSPDSESNKNPNLPIPEPSSIQDE